MKAFDLVSKFKIHQDFFRNKVYPKFSHNFKTDYLGKHQGCN